MGLKDYFDKLKFSSFNEPSSGFGLDFSDSHLRGLAIELDSGKIFAKFLKSMPLAEDSIRDGKILKKLTLIDALSSIREEAQKKATSLEGSGLVVPVPDSRTYFTLFKLSSTAKGEAVERAVQRKAKNLSSIDLEEFYSDYSELPSNKDYKEVAFLALPRKIVEDYSEVAVRSGLDISIFEPEFLSLARAFSPLLQDKKGVVIFDCGRRNTTVSIFSSAAPRYLEEIELAGEKFTQVIANNLDVSEKEAEKLKKEEGLKKEELRKALAPVLNSMVNQFTEILDRARAKKNLAPEKLLLSGGSSLLPGFKDYFEKNLNLEVIRPDPFSAHEIRLASSDLSERKIFFSPLVGASLRKLDNPTSLPLINFISNN